MQQNISENNPVTFSYWDFIKNMSNDAKRSLIIMLQKSLDVSESEQKISRMTFAEAKEYLSSRKLPSRNVPEDFNGMRDEVNPKYL